MTVKELIALLEKCPEDAKIRLPLSWVYETEIGVQYWINDNEVSVPALNIDKEWENVAYHFYK